MTGAPARVAVIGAGRMGAGIAHGFASAGSQVTLRDIDDAAVARGVASITASLRKARERDSGAPDPDEVLGRVQTAIGPAGIGPVDLVVEAVPEIPSLKLSVLEQVAAGVPAQTVIATNTSSISIGELAHAVADPSRFLGMHFFNPVPVSRLVEVIRAGSTADRAVELAVQWTAALGKQAIVVADVAGFATSRLGLAVGLEAVRMLEDGVASAEDIDRGMVLGYGFPVGPLRLTDIVGLDVRLEIAQYLERALGPRFAPPELLRRKVRDGELGRKSGRGFYDWSGETEAPS